MGKAIQGCQSLPNLRGRNFLMAPGPTNIPERVLRAMHRPAVELSTPEFVAMCRTCIDDLGRIFRTEAGQEVFIYPANGHGAWEAALTNTLASGDRVLVPVTGPFPSAWGRIAAAIGVEVEELAGDWRHGIDPGQVEQRLRADHKTQIKALLLVHTDTATGITSDLQAVAKVVESLGHPALLMVDAVASLAATDFQMAEWHIDVAVGASQKALMAPPGLSFSAVSERALALSNKVGTFRFYWDWRMRQTDQWYDWFCGIAPEHLLFALREAMDMVLEEGLAAVFARHQRLASAVRAAVQTWEQQGALSLNALNPHEQSNSVSTVRVNDDVKAGEIIRICRDELNVSLGGALGALLEGKAFRIGHMGDINEPMILGALASIETALRRSQTAYGAGGVDAAIEVLAR